MLDSLSYCRKAGPTSNVNACSGIPAKSLANFIIVLGDYQSSANSTHYAKHESISHKAIERELDAQGAERTETMIPL